MTLEQIIALSKAGFEAEQIKAIYETVSKPAAVEENSDLMKRIENIEKKLENKQEDNDFNTIVNKLDDFENLIKTNAILNSSQPKKESVNDILASIINPPNNK